MLTGDLAALWRDPGRAPAQRKAAILHLWDAFDPGAAHVDPELSGSVWHRMDDERRRAAQGAQQRILDAVRVHLPASHPDAFTPHELAEFNGRDGASVVFEPYGQP